jgi:hypothetical protein
MTDDAAAIRAEWRAEEADWSRAAFEHWEHGRGLADVLRDCLHRGDRVTFAFASLAWSGEVAGVGDAPFVLRIRPRCGSWRDTRMTRSALTTFAARLRELDGTSVSIGIPTGPLEGTMRIGRDQVRLVDRDGNASYVPLRAVGWVRPLDD